jgi:DNA-binding MarR family transcriptional regulator
MSPGKRKSPAGTAGTRDANLTTDAWNLYRAVSELVRVYQFRDRKRICYYDVSVTQCHALGVIVGDGPMTLNSLAAELYLDKSTTSRVTDSLEKKGYVRRSADANDARALRLEVTKTGRDLHERITQDLVGEMKTLLESLDPDVRRATGELIARLAETASRRFSGSKAADAEPGAG